MKNPGYSRIFSKKAQSEFRKYPRSHTKGVQSPADLLSTGIRSALQTSWRECNSRNEVKAVFRRRNRH
ncbi:MAG: hypothetical protein DMG38_05045 [Acidobacteria bacterium]|nr:MAG: hypothetical protein DMG38_05045 [Acidobacteriota bacterium]